MKQTREMLASGRYLNVPVSADAPRRLIRLVTAGKVVRAFEVELATGDVDFWAFVDVSDWAGETLEVNLSAQPTVANETIQINSAEHPLVAGCLNALEVVDEIKEAHELYGEALRPQFHFTVKRGWHNDPNGMFYHEGEYHLFYQYQPFSVSSFSDKSWGHAVSRDLVHWEEKAVALHPDLEGGKWSGSGVVDHHNVSGLQLGKEPPVLLFYTATGDSAQDPHPGEAGRFVQSIAYSHDRGLTWKAYEGNPIIPNLSPGNRDPLVFWHEPTQRWVMTLYVGEPESWLRDGNRSFARLFTSENLTDWREESAVEGFFDCPALFSLPLDGDENDLRWVMHCADMKYKIGRFDGRVFTPETDFLVGQIGDCAYAPQLFNHAPGGRRIQIAWGRTEAPGMPFSQIMCFPCDLAMISTESGPRMRWQPVKEIETLWNSRAAMEGRVINSEEGAVELAQGVHLDLELCLEMNGTSAIDLIIRGLKVQCDPQTQTLRANGYEAPLLMRNGKLSLRFLVDRTSLEIFADGGLVYMPLATIPDPDQTKISLQASGGSITVNRLECRELKSIWRDLPVQ